MSDNSNAHKDKKYYYSLGKYSLSFAPINPLYLSPLSTYFHPFPPIRFILPLYKWLDSSSKPWTMLIPVGAFIYS